MPSRFASSNSGCVSASGHRPLVPVVGLGDVVDEPAREERRERQLRVHDELDAVLVRLVQQREQPLDDLLAGVVALDRARAGRRRRSRCGHSSLSSSFAGGVPSASAQSTCSSTSAPAARSSVEVCSAGLWLMPCDRRHEDHRRSGTRGPASGRRGRRRSASAARCCRAGAAVPLDEVDDAWVELDRLEAGQRAVLDRDPLGRRDADELGGDRGLGLLQDGLGRVAHVERHRRRGRRRR